MYAAGAELRSQAMLSASLVGLGKVAASGPCLASSALPFPSRKPVASS